MEASYVNLRFVWIYVRLFWRTVVICEMTCT